MTDANRSADPKTIGDALPKEMARVRDEVLSAFLELRGLPNVICEPQIAMIRASLDFAANAMARGDVVAMLQAYNDLKEYEA